MTLSNLAIIFLFTVAVGAGSAGVIMAGRLSESQQDSVLLLEAGIEAMSPPFSIPIVTPLLQHTDLDWQYRSEPQMNACFGLENNVRSKFYIVVSKYACVVIWNGRKSMLANRKLL
jgi:choline dehydrogenase-like flavoprotein